MIVTVPGAVLEALNLGGVIWFGGNKDEYVVVLGTPGQVEAVRPDLGRIRRLPVSRVLVTAPGGDDADFTSRNFAPVLGLDEDQATGSAHAVLGPLWAGRLGRRRLSALQASVRRGRLAVAVEDDRVHVGGHAITTTRGEWVLQTRNAGREDLPPGSPLGGLNAGTAGAILAAPRTRSASSHRG